MSISIKIEIAPRCILRRVILQVVTTLHVTTRKTTINVSTAVA
jgi:hypothetical protein